MSMIDVKVCFYGEKEQLEALERKIHLACTPPTMADRKRLECLGDVFVLMQSGTLNKLNYTKRERQSRCAYDSCLAHIGDRGYNQGSPIETDEQGHPVLYLEMKLTKMQVPDLTVLRGTQVHWVMWGIYQEGFGQTTVSDGFTEATGLTVEATYETLRKLCRLQEGSIIPYDEPHFGISRQFAYRDDTREEEG